MRTAATHAREFVLGVVAAGLLVLFLAEDVGGARRGEGPRRGDEPERRRATRALFELRSAGPDARMGTADDVVWPEPRGK